LEKNIAPLGASSLYRNCDFFYLEKIMKNKDVISMFLKNQDAVSHTGSLKSEGGILYSYSLRIAKNTQGLFLVYPAIAKYNLYCSNTTARHVNQALSIIPKECTLLVFNQFELEE